MRQYGLPPRLSRYTCLPHHSALTGKHRRPFAVRHVTDIGANQGSEPELLFSFFNMNRLLLWALWGCGRRVRVVQETRQIYRAFPAVAGVFLLAIAKQAPFCAVDRDAMVHPRGCEDHSLRSVSPPPLEVTLKCP